MKEVHGNPVEITNVKEFEALTRRAKNLWKKRGYESLQSRILQKGIGIGILRQNLLPDEFSLFGSLILLRIVSDDEGVRNRSEHQELVSYIEERLDGRKKQIMARLYQEYAKPEHADGAEMEFRRILEKVEGALDALGLLVLNEKGNLVVSYIPDPVCT